MTRCGALITIRNARTHEVDFTPAQHVRAAERLGLRNPSSRWEALPCPDLSLGSSASFAAFPARGDLRTTTRDGRDSSRASATRFLANRLPFKVPLAEYAILPDDLQSKGLHVLLGASSFAAGRRPTRPRSEPKTSRFQPRVSCTPCAMT